ncbi:MAG: hypothetical protein M5R40_02900 [Anaerolineae bacterium]|nr:hypothetical protein [Anaerolineae bacterium]
MIFLILEPREGIVSIMSAYFAPGDLEAVEPTVRAIAASVAFNR